MFFKKSIFILLSVLLAIFSHPVVLFGFHFPNLGFLAFIAYIPLLLLISKESPFKQFKITFCFAFLSYLGGMYWLYPALRTFADLSFPLSVAILIIFIGLLSLFFALIFFVSCFIENSLHLSRFWILPFIWISFEWIRTYWPLGGFPWGQVGYSQWEFSSLIQVTAITGVYGITAFAVWINLLIVELIQKRENYFVKLKIQSSLKLLFLGILTLFIFFYGKFAKEKIGQEIQNAPRFRVALLQGNIPQNEKQDPEKLHSVLQTYLAMTHQASLEKIDLVIWPETSYPFQIPLELQDENRNPLSVQLASYPENLLIGAITSSRGEKETGRVFYNSALLIDSQKNRAKILGTYYKQHLIPFGEYIPFQNIFPFLRRTKSSTGDYSPGKDALPLFSQEARLGLLICYEDNFPEIARDRVRKGANLLVNLSNDAWYGDSSALYQHLTFSSFRAIENRRSLIRSTNTGITVTVDPLGHFQNRLSAWKREILTDEIALLSSLTFYSRYGDVFAYGCLGITVILLTVSTLKRKRFS